MVTAREHAAALTKAAADGDLALIQALLAAVDADVNAQDEDGDTALHAACANGHAAVVHWLLDAGARLDIKNEDGDSVLHAAISSGEAEAVDMLIASGCKDLAGLQDEEKWAAVEAALETESVDMLLCLVKHGVDLSGKGADGSSVLHLAAQANNVDAIAYLAKDARMDMNKRNVLGQTPLYDAVAESNFEAAKELLKNGAHVDAKDNDEETALMIAIDRGNTQLVALLLDAGADVNSTQDQGWTPLHCAASCGEMATIELLLNRGADLHRMSTDGRSVLSCAASSTSEAAISFFARECPGDINKADEHGWAPVHYAASRGDAKVLKLLIELGADIDVVTKTSESPLMIAARVGRVETASMMAEYGQDVNTVEDEHCWSVLHAAAHFGNVDVIEMLLQHGTDWKAKDKEGVSVLHTAASAGHTAAVMALIQAGADAKAAQEENGWTTLHYAAAGGSVELLQSLLQSGADVHATTKDGKMVLHVACAKGQRDVVTYLLTLGVDANAVDEIGRTAMHYAAQVDRGCVSSLLSSGLEVSVNIADKDGYLPLHLSADELVLEETTKLLEAGADVNALTKDGAAALELALFPSECNDVPLLARAQADIARILCAYGSSWTERCEANLATMRREVEGSEAEIRDQRRQNLEWIMGMRACVRHWEQQQQNGVRELINVPIEVVRKGEDSVLAFVSVAQ